MVRDISVTVRDGAPVWPGDPPTSCRWMSSIGQGASVNVSAMTWSPHAGTHADSPLHVRDGWPGSHELPLDIFCGETVVVSIPTTDDEVSVDTLSRLLPDGAIERVLLKTGRTVA